jgi:2,3-bisphosphoglycerate-dependent phosphoglycerate mutase
MSIVLLIKHSLPAIRPELPSVEWPLSQAGRRRCFWLADRLRHYGISVLYSSPEPKALETASLVSAQLNVPCRTHPGLRENDRTGFPFVSTDELMRRFSDFFDYPERICIGGERALSAAYRFDRAVNDVLREAQRRTTGIVSHGAVITLFVTRYNSLDPFELWQSLALPSFICATAAAFECREVVNYDG